MSATLGGLWDGERHLLEPEDGQFPAEGATWVIDGWDEDEEEDVLSPFESATLIPRLRDTRDPKLDSPKFPNSRLEQAWGTLSVTLTAMASIVGVDKKQYQEVDVKNNTVGWSFQTAEFITERM